MRMLRMLICGLMAAFSSLALFAQTPIRVIYVNGILNSKEEALLTLQTVQDALNTPHRHTVGSRSFAVELQYNPLGWHGVVDGDVLFQDSVELFLLKYAEEQYIVDLLKLKSPANSTSELTDLQAATNVAQFAEKLTVMNTGISRDYSTSPYGTRQGDNDIERDGTSLDTKLILTEQCISELAAKMTSATAPIIIIAHSQGNLITNLAYAKAARDMYPRKISSFVKIVNIANTSSVSLHNLNLTHIDDNALFAPVLSLKHLPGYNGWSRAVPSVDPTTQTTTYSLTTGDFTLDTPTATGLIGGVWADITEHSLVDTYLSTDLCAMSDTRGIVLSSGSNCLRDYFEDLVWTAAQSLEVSAAMPVVSMLNPCVIAGEGQNVTLSATATSQVGALTDVHWERLDHPEVSFSLPSLANNSTNGNTITSSVPFTTPFVSATTTFKIGFFAKDDRGMTSSGVAEVQVQHANTAPTITADARYTATTGTSVSLHASAQDTDGFLASASIEQVNNLSWLLLSSPQTLMTYGGNLGSWDIPVSIAGNVPGGTYTFRVTVVDNDGAISMRNIDLVITPNYFVDDFSTVSSVIGSHWAVNSFGSSAFVSGGELNLQHLVAQSMSLGTRAFHEGTNFRAYAKLSDGGSVRFTAGMDGMAIVQNLPTAPHRYQVQTWVTDPNTYETQTQYTDLDITPDTYHLFEYIYGLDGMITLLVDQVTRGQMPSTPSFFYGARMQFSYGQTLNGTGTLVKWAGVTP